jgi:hypothetical protein
MEDPSTIRKAVADMGAPYGGDSPNGQTIAERLPALSGVRKNMYTICSTFAICSFVGAGSILDRQWPIWNVAAACFAENAGNEAPNPGGERHAMCPALACSAVTLVSGNRRLGGDVRGLVPGMRRVPWLPNPELARIFRLHQPRENHEQDSLP